MRYSSFMACGAALLFALAARADLVSGISVVVNDSVITYAEIQGAVAPRAQLAAQLYANEPARLQEEVQKLKDQQIEQLVERKLILHEFITSGYATNVVESFIDGQIQDKIKREYYGAVSYTHLRAHETGRNLVCRLLLE